MLPDQEVELVEKEIGRGHRIRNLSYIHHSCAYDVFSGEDEAALRDSIDLFSLLSDITDEVPEDESPYAPLSEYFRTCERTPLMMHFSEIEQIIGQRLDWEAYFFEAFWYENPQDSASSMWVEEGFPFDTLRITTPEYHIADSWLMQGYRIKSLDLHARKVVFRKINPNISGLVVPRQLTTKKLPNTAIYELEQSFKHVIQKYGL